MRHTSVKMEYPCEFINITPINPLISHCEIKVCYVGKEANRNKSIITKEVARDLANSLPGSPIVGYFNEAKGDFEEHNRIIEISNGEFKLKDTTRPYGFVDLNAKVWFQKYLDDGINEREYLMTEGYIWTGQYPEAQRIIEKGNNQSMELDDKIIDAYWTKDKNGNPQFFIINEAIISKLCILGEECEPCFEGATITAPTLQFAFEDSFKQQLFSMMNEMKIVLKGGALKMTTYAVEIGSNLWEHLFNHAENLNSDLIATMEENEITFAVLQDRESKNYFKVNFSYNEDNFVIEEKVEFSYEPAAEPQFDVNAVAEYKKKKDEEEEKKENPNSSEENDPKEEEPNNDDEDEDEKKKKDKKAKYNLDEIPEYVELSNNYSELESKYNLLVAEMETKNAQLSELTEFRKAAERKDKEDMINKFYMLSNEEKQDVITNIDTYSLDDIEAKLSIICVRNKVNFNLDEDNNPGTDPLTYNLNGSSLEDDSMPAWIKRVMGVAKTLN